MRVIAGNIALAALLAAPLVRAQEAPHLFVDRGAGAEQCPDAEALTLRIEQIRGRSQRELASTYRVSFVRKEDGFTAIISTGPTGANVRTLENAGTTCTMLGNATALTLALLFDSDVREKKKRETPAVTAAPITILPPPPPPPRYRIDATLALSALGLVGVLRPASLGGAAEAGIAGRRWRMSLGAIWALPQSIDFGPGTVREELLSGVARTCFAPVRQGWLRIDVCSGAVVGLVTAEAVGFTSNERHTRPWVAVPVELAVGGWSSPVAWEIAAGALFALRRQDFSIEGLGIAYKSPPVGGMLSFRVIGLVPW